MSTTPSGMSELVRQTTKRHWWTMVEVKHAFEMRARGKSFTVIGNKFGVSDESVRGMFRHQREIGSRYAQ